MSVMGDESLTTGALARELGVTDECVRRWAEQGMPCRMVQEAGRRYRLYSLAAAREWRAANRGATLHGGRRRGAGRKPGKRAKREAASRIDFADAQRRAAESEAQRDEALKILRAISTGTLAEPVGDGAAPGGRMPVDGLLGLTEHEIRVLALLPEEVSGWTPNQAARLKQLHEARVKEHELRQRYGKVVPVERVRAEARALATAMVAALDELIDHATRGVMEAISAGAGAGGAGGVGVGVGVEAVRAAVERAVIEARQSLAERLEGRE